MGIKNFNTVIKNHAPSAVKNLQMKDYENETLAIDVSIYMYKFCMVGDGNYLDSFLKQYKAIRRAKVFAIYVFDGTAPELKGNELSRRKMEKNKMKMRLAKEAVEIKKRKQILMDEIWMQTHEKNIGGEEYYINEEVIKTSDEVYLSPLYKIHNELNQLEVDEVNIASRQRQCSPISYDNFRHLQEMFDDHRIPYIIASGEAEKTCVLLTKLKIAKAVVTDDTDALAFGADIMIKSFSPSSYTSGKEVNRNIILEQLDMNDTEFLDLCLLCGCDYVKIPSIAHITALEIIKKYRSIENYVVAKPKNKIDFTLIQSARREFTIDLKDYATLKVNILDKIKNKNASMFV